MKIETDQRRDFLRLFLRHESELRAFIGSIVRDVHVREDLLQEISLTMWQAHSRFDANRSFSAWARGIAANKLRQFWDKNQRTPVSFSPESVTAIADAFDRREEECGEQLEALEQCVELLPNKSRRLMTLRYGHSLTLKEVAERSDCTLTAVHKAITRIRERLRGCVERRLAAAGRILT